MKQITSILMIAILTGVLGFPTADAESDSSGEIPSVTGVSESFGPDNHEMEECRAAMFNAWAKAKNRCQLAGLSGDLNYESYNPCLNRIMIGGKKVSLSYQCGK